MIIPNRAVYDTLMHWCGERKLAKPVFVCIQKNLEGNVKSEKLLRPFGNSVVPAYVGFIDLADFSRHVHGMDPEQIATYLGPFLTKGISVLSRSDALVDKMIGDELMFVLPEYDGIGEHGTLLRLGQLLGRMYDLSSELGADYRYRIGLSYGSVMVYLVKGEGYSEWTVVGEPVHVAERLQSIPEMKKPTPVCGAFGIPDTGEADRILKSRLQVVAGPASRFMHEAPTSRKLKGVGRVLLSYLS